MKKFLPSRLARKQKTKNLRQAVFFSLLTLLLVLAIFYFGLPTLIKLSVFLGNLRSSSVVPPSEDKIPTTPPIILPLPEATSSAKISLSGFAEPAATIEILNGGISQIKTVAESDGSFKINNLEITAGRNEIYAVATDKAGNISQPSEKIIVIFDNTPPKLEVLQPEDNATFYGFPKSIEVKGKTDEEATVTINDHLAIMEAEGKFSYSLTLVRGENKIKIVATDKAGNQIEQELTVFLE